MNPSDQRFEERWLRRLAAVERELRDLKTAQAIGLDSMSYDITDVVSSSIFLNSGDDHTQVINFIADKKVYYNSNLTVSFFINNDLDPDYRWPDGPALTTGSGLRPFDHVEWYDFYASDELGAGRTTWKIYMMNWGAFAKTIHYHAALVFPRGGVA
jgi:hypothetical protein